MTAICDDLKFLLEDYPNCAGAYGWYVEERDDWSGYEKYCEDALTQWVKSVEAILELNGKDKELQIWRNATSRGGSEEAHKIIWV